MNRTKETIEAGLTLFQQILMDIPGIGQEFETSRMDFQSNLPEDEQEAALTRRRHFEWYLLERDSKNLDGIPIQVCMDTWTEAAPHEVADMAESLLHSFAGVFEVSSADPQQGLWLSDLFGLGEYPVEPSDNAEGIKAGDLVVGRIFPIGDGVYSISQAASLYREKKLIKAVRRDLSSLRESRRGVMRIGQHEIERLFFEVSVSQDGANSDGIDLSKERATAKRGLLKAGLDESQIEDVLIEITKASAESDSSAVTRILNALAFENEVDLGLAHRLLSNLWAAETSPGAEKSNARSKSSGKVGSEKVEDVRAALAKFDQLKAAGGDVENLYEELTQELGIHEPNEGTETITLPDFPGVLSAVIDEFLWDVERTQGAPKAMSLDRIRLLGQFGKEIGVFEELGRSQVLDFAGRWLLDEGELRDAEDARACLHALREFCSWAQEEHSHPLLDDCDEFLQPLAKSIPRLVLLKKCCVARESIHKPLYVVAIKGTCITLLDENQRESEADVDSNPAGLIRAGDLLHGVIKEGRLQLTSCYPEELRKLLDFKQ